MQLPVKCAAEHHDDESPGPPADSLSPAAPAGGPPYPIQLFLTMLFAAFVLVQYHFEFGSNGNDGLPGVFGPAQGRGKRLFLLCVWYLPLVAACFLLPLAVFPANASLGFWLLVLWMAVFLMVVAYAEVFPEYYRPDGSRIVYPDGNVKPVDYNVTLYNPSKRVRWMIDGRINWHNVSFVLVFLISHLHSLVIILNPDIPWSPASLREAMKWPRDVMYATWESVRVPWLVWSGVWGNFAVVIVWLAVFGHFACKPDSMLVRAAKGERGVLPGFSLFRFGKPLFCEALFFPIARTCFATLLLCRDDGAFQLDPSQACWHGGHSVAAVLAMLCLLLFVPIGAGASIINCCCNGAFEAPHRDIRIVPLVLVTRRLSFLALLFLKVMLNTRKTPLALVLAYIVVNLCMVRVYQNVRARSPECLEPPGSALRLGAKGVYAACCIPWFVRFQVIVFAICAWTGCCALLAWALPNSVMGILLIAPGWVGAIYVLQKWWRGRVKSARARAGSLPKELAEETWVKPRNVPSRPRSASAPALRRSVSDRPRVRMSLLDLRRPFRSASFRDRPHSRARQRASEPSLPVMQLQSPVFSAASPSTSSASPVSGAASPASSTSPPSRARAAAAAPQRGSSAATNSNSLHTEDSKADASMRVPRPRTLTSMSYLQSILEEAHEASDASSGGDSADESMPWAAAAGLSS